MTSVGGGALKSNNADSLNSNFLQLGRRSGGRPQRTVYPRRLLVNTVIHTTLAGFEPTTFPKSGALPVVPLQTVLQALHDMTTDRANSDCLSIQVWSPFDDGAKITRSSAYK